MPYSVREQLRRVRRLHRELHPAKIHVFLVEEGDELTDEQRAQVKPQDTIVIRYLPKGYLRGLLLTREEYEEAHGQDGS